MKAWKPQRASAFAPGFDDYLESLGLGLSTHWLWDNAIHELEDVLCGADRDQLDIVYPPDQNGLRLVLTEQTRGLPPLRILFYLDEADADKVVYVAVARRA